MEKSIKNRIKSVFLHHFSRGQKLVFAFVIILTVLFEVSFILMLTDVKIQEKKDAAIIYGNSVASNITLAINHSIAMTMVIKDLYLEYGDNFYKEFDNICARFMEDDSTIGSIYLAPDGVIKKAYPPAVEEYTLGFNMLEDPIQGVMAYKAIETKHPVIAGPHYLLEGGIGLIIRNPIFENDEFKAFSILVVNWDELINQIEELRNNNSYYLGLWKESDGNSRSAADNFIYKNCSKNIEKDVNIPIPISNDIWYLSLEPVNGWIKPATIVFLALIAAIILISFVVFVYYRQVLSSKKMYQAEHDALTGLLTRGTFYHRVEKLFKQNPEKSYDVLVADIENFKVINSIYGVEKGDEILQEYAKFLKFHNDTGLNARYGGDQFICICESSENKGQNYLEMFTKDFVKKIGLKNLVFKYGYYGNVDKRLAVSMICDRALMAAKSILHNYEKNIANYDGPVSQQILQEQMFESSFEEALQNEEFQVWYQPKFSAVTEKIVGAEALVRWIKKDGKIISPSDFIYVFENDGLIARLDEFVFRKVCETLKKIKDKGYKLLPISINISRVSLYHKGVIQKYRGIVESYGIPIEYVPLELTESATSKNTGIIELTEELKAAGFKIHMDDFGTGLSSLESLNIMPYDVIKLDKSLIDFIGDAGGNELLRHMIELLHFKKMIVVAEGVENINQLDFLRSLKCDIIQGYYYTAPMNYENCIEYVKKLISDGRV